MARDPETIERDIEKARDQLATTLDRIGDRANPQKLATTAQAGVRAKLDEPRVKYPLVGTGVLVAVLLVRKLLR